MKKSIFKISLLVIPLFIGSFGIHGTASAACMNQFGAKKFSDSLTVIRSTDPNITIQTQYKQDVSKDHPDCAGVTIPGSFYDITMSYLGPADTSWKDIPIADSSIKLTAGNWGTIKTAPGVFTDKNAIYSVRFKEENELPDYIGPQFTVWKDTAEFGEPVLKAGSITDSSVIFDGTVTYKNNAAAAAGKLVPDRNIIMDVYKNDGSIGGKFIKEVALNSQSNLKYNEKRGLNITVTGLEANTEYSVDFRDKNRTLFDQSVSRSFTTLKKKPATTSANSTSTSGSGTTSSGTNNQTSSTSTTTTTTTNASGLARFSGSSERYPGIKFDGDITPELNGSILKIKGEVTYSYTSTTAPASIISGGLISIALADGNSTVAKINTEILGGQGTVIQYGIPYRFETTFDNYNRYLDEDGVPINSSVRPVPFNVRISDENLSLKSAIIPVVENVTTTTSSTVLQNGGMAPQTSTSTAAANGSKVTFTVSNATLATNGLVAIDGTVKYTPATDGTTPTPKNITASLIDKNNVVVKSNQPVTISGNKISTNFVNQDLAKAPFTFNLKDTDLGVGSPSPFKVAAASASNSTQQPTNQNNGDGISTTKIEFSSIIDAVDKDETSASVTTSVTFKNTGKGNTVIPAGSTVTMVAIDASNNNKVFTSTNLIPSGSKYNTALPITATATGLNKTKTYLIQFSATDGTIKDIKSGSKQFSFVENTPTNGDNTGSNGKIKLKNPTPFNSIIELVNALVRNVVIPIAVPFLALAIMYTGFLFVTAKGNPTKIEKAKEALKYTLLGGAIILAAYVIATALQGTINDIIK